MEKQTNEQKRRQTETTEIEMEHRMINPRDTSTANNYWDTASSLNFGLWNVISESQSTTVGIDKHLVVVLCSAKEPKRERYVFCDQLKQSRTDALVYVNHLFLICRSGLALCAVHASVPALSGRFPGRSKDSLVCHLVSEFWTRFQVKYMNCRAENCSKRVLHNGLK